MLHKKTVRAAMKDWGGSEHLGMTSPKKWINLALIDASCTDRSKIAVSDHVKHDFDSYQVDYWHELSQRRSYIKEKKQSIRIWILVVNLKILIGINDKHTLGIKLEETQN